MIIISELKKDDKPTIEAIKQVHEAEKLPIIYDEDCPELTPELEGAMIEAAKRRNIALAE